MRQPTISIAFPKRPAMSNGTRLLAADIGGTKTDLALFEIHKGELMLMREVVFTSHKFSDVAEMLQRFNGEKPIPERLSIAFAGPVQDGKAEATNLNWHIDTAQLSRTLGIPKVYLINDLEAEAYGLAGLAASELRTVYPGLANAGGNAAIIAPGTGLGEAGLYWDGASLRPFATEGGHADFAPRDEFDWRLLEYLQKKFGHVSWERVVSGPGIENIFRFLRDHKNWDVPASLRAKMKDHDMAEAIGLAAESDCPVCVQTLRRFVQYLAVEASNLALKFKATGGVYLGGGILPKIWNEHLEAVFFEQFVQVGRMQPLLESMPVYLVLNPKTALIGAALYGCGGCSMASFSFLQNTAPPVPALLYE